jgi:hypothetical protein
MLSQRVLAALRAGGPAAEAARSRVAHAHGSPGVDPNAALRAEVADALIASLLPSDRAVTRWLLEQEVEALRAAGRGVTETLYSLVAALARFGDPEDALLLWRAREATAETRGGVDVEQLARAGVERVRAHLARLIAAGGQAGAEAERALAWFEEGLAAGALQDLAAYFAWSDERFGLIAGAPA